MRPARLGRLAAHPVFARPYLLLGLTTLIWGANAVAGRLAIGNVSPLALTALRWLVALAALLPFVARDLRAEWPAVRPHLGRLVLLGALGYTCFNALFYWAAHHTTAVNMGVIQGVTPALVMGASAGLYGVRIRPLQLAGLALTLVGVAVTASRGSLDALLSLGFNVGDLGILLAATLYAGYTVALRRRPAVSPLVFFAVMACGAFLTSLPLVALEAAAGAFQAPTAFGWAIVVFVALLPSLAAQIFYIRGVELIGPDRAGLFMNLVPVSAALLGVLILGETFAPYHAAALALVLGGIWLAESRAG